MEGVDITECRTFEELPENAQRYVEYLEKITGVPVSIIAVGPIATRPSCEAGIGNVPPFCRTAERLDAAKRDAPDLAAMPTLAYRSIPYGDFLRGALRPRHPHDLGHLGASR